MNQNEPAIAPDVARRLAELERELPRAQGKKLALPRLSSAAKPGLPAMRAGGWKQALGRKLLSWTAALVLASLCLPPFYWPAEGPVTSEFFLRVKPDSRRFGLEIHHGIDIGAARGSTVRPAAWGFVSAAGYDEALGNYVRVSHALGASTLYAHLERVQVRRGAFVVPGLSALGSVGSTGRSTGPHLHFGCYLGPQALPPRLFLAFHSARRGLLGF